MDHVDFQPSHLHLQGDTSTDDEMPTPSQLRKSNKPLLEKKRRARINKSLEQLKSLVLEALKKDSARYSKLEKADILEMTVKHLREIQRHQMAVAMSVDPTVLGKYRAGFNECAQEVNRYLGTIDGLNTEVRMRMMQHLANSFNQNRQAAPPVQTPPPGYGMPGATSVTSLPGYAMRSGLPFGGLALSPDSPTLSVSPSVPSPSYDYRVTSRERCIDPAMTSSPCTSFSQSYSSRDKMGYTHENTENIAPAQRVCRPLMEKNGNVFDRNNNAVHMPVARPMKVERAESKAPPATPTLHNDNEAMRMRAAAMAAMAGDVKLEPVWRPW